MKISKKVIYTSFITKSGVLSLRSLRLRKEAISQSGVPNYGYQNRWGLALLIEVRHILEELTAVSPYNKRPLYLINL
jgi:hypothetical protein